MNDTIEIHEEKDSGFTLIELLIVIVILGILATVTVFAVGGITDRGEVSACDAEYKTVEVAVEAYYALWGEYPPNLVPSLTEAPNKFLNSAPTLVGYDALTGAVTKDCEAVAEDPET